MAAKKRASGDRARPRATPHPVKKKPGAYHHGDLRAAMVRAGVTLIQEHGVAGLTIAHAAAAAGVVASAPYRHFADREALLATIAEEGFLELASALLAVERQEEGAGRLEKLAVVYVEFARAHPAHFRAMFAADLDKAKHPALAAAGERAFAVLERGGAQLAGARPSRARLLASTTALWSMVHGFAVLSLDDAFARLDDGPVAPLVLSAVKLLTR